MVANNKNILVSVDIGATSGRVMKTTYCNGKYSCLEVHRFKNRLINEKGHIFWDMFYLIKEISKALTKIKIFSSIGISTWGCDICLIDKSGSLIRNPLCYRDECYLKMDKELFTTINYYDLYQKVGVQRLPFNTFTQLAYLKLKEPEIYNKVDKVLMIPDYLAYYFTGNMRLEETNASTSGCYNLQKEAMDASLLELIGVNPQIFPKLIHPKESYGMISQNICEKLKITSAQVIACASHDTASAILGSLATNKSAYISSGTWSLIGTLLDEQILSSEAYLTNFTNEIGYNKKIRFLKNIMGMWILEEYRHELIENIQDASFEIIINDLKAPNDNITYIDPDDEMFIAAGNMSSRIQEYAKQTKQFIPSTRAEFVQTIYYSLVLKYKLIYERLQSITKCNFEYLNIIGGGSKNDILSQMVADALGIKVIAGPNEATILGNVFVQLMASDLIKDSEINKLLKNNEKLKIFNVTKEKHDDWKKEYMIFKNILEVRNGRC